MKTRPAIHTTEIAVGTDFLASGADTSCIISTGPAHLHGMVFTSLIP
ncbi:MAG: hypothetical protein IPN60_06615 [Saprospiraceae bacterium]|nr:hypothetical protein [Candidatus Opimibacter skivensis]MBL0008776.1 hypothetical protein [Candidatus Opimibacter skivensis]